MANSELPPEIIFEIFTYLPTRSVGKFKYLSKTWNTNLSTSQFINLRETRKTHSIVLVTQSGSIHEVTPKMIGFSRQIQADGRWTHLLGSSKGLVLLLEAKTRKLFVVNPITRKQVEIPDPPSNEIIRYGFGYDSSTDDFKVVTITYQHGRTRTNVFVYYMKTRVWKTIDYPFGGRRIVFSIFTCKAVALVHGALHWLFYRQSDISICVFDLATESFREINLPKESKQDSDCNELAVVRGCLAIISIYPDRTASVWVMNEYGVSDSWVRFRIQENVMPNSLVRPVCFVGDEEMLCVTGGKCWTVYDLKEGMWRNKVDGPVPFSFYDWMVFEESFVSPE